MRDRDFWDLGDFLGLDPIKRLPSKFNQLRLGLISVHRKNLEAIAPLLWPVEC